VKWEGSTLTDKRLPHQLAVLVRSMKDDRGDASPAEGLRLIKAFLSIKNTAIRTTLIELVEKIAAEFAVKTKR
jgi:hypothetical protein